MAHKLRPGVARQYRKLKIWAEMNRVTLEHYRKYVLPIMFSEEPRAPHVESQKV